MESAVHEESTSEVLPRLPSCKPDRTSSDGFLMRLQRPQMERSIFNGLIPWKIISVVPRMPLQIKALLRNFFHLTGFVKEEEGLSNSCVPICNCSWGLIN